MLKLNGHQRYLPPPPLSYSQQNLSTLGAGRDELQSNYSKYTSERHLDDMHDWAIYRTNVNSKYAGGAMQKSQSLPFGEFYLDPSTVDSLHSNARFLQASTFAAENDPHMYIEFGLPRLTATPKSGAPSKAYSTANIPEVTSTGQWHRERKMGHSSGDVRESSERNGDARRRYQRSRSYDAILEEPSREDTAHLISREDRKERHDELRRISRSQQGLDNIAYSADDVREHKNNAPWENTWDRISTRASQRRPNEFQDDIISAVNANLKVTESYYKPSSNLAYDTHPANYRRPAQDRYSFKVQKNRGYLENNWRGFGSMDELRSSPYPHLQLRNVTHEVKVKPGPCKRKRTLRLLDNLSFEAHGGEIMAIMGHSGK